jgi:8-oxo-dGTP pyrophosphatase MutT (NUDIX family)
MESENLSKVTLWMVCGFLFDPTGHMVVLIEKDHPAGQAGKLNGVGGKKQDGETWEQAMSREFEEEALTVIPSERWEAFATIRAPRWDGQGEFLVKFFRCFDMLAYRAETGESEHVIKRDVLDLFRDPDHTLVVHTKAMVALALDRELVGANGVLHFVERVGGNPTKQFVGHVG